MTSAHTQGEAAASAPHRVVIALGGNAIAPAGAAGTAEEQTDNIARAMHPVAALLADGWAVVLTHGNGPQVGNLLLKNEVARDLVPPVPLDWCVAQTQATIGFTIANVLERHLDDLGLRRLVAPVTSRVRVDRDDPAFGAPSKPIGGWIGDELEVHRRQQAGQVFTHDAQKGWRRLVPSPEPLESLDRRAAEVLLSVGGVVVANGGGGVPTVRGDDGWLHGLEAVVDKDLAGALLARELDADVYVILTDVAGVAIDFGTPQQRWLDKVDVHQLRAWQADGQFAAGSMGPKVEAACRFVEQTGGRAAIAALDDAAEAVHSAAGTQVLP